ncbi:zinc-binding dehydrogenase [Petroclostridium sp. X23]|uniref:zinc-dependent alcohol dehydrogenase n=1 Tax=Petroclostridium sp. X23 TaxID=3045146 RepID=UPI0024AD58BE|nr:zinc-binding dehydrogenase [Petroclostridium sp. X23]WHH60496.1 zinc-binding dehydrogenase [Petroclostridium sp. X23]
MRCLVVNDKGELSVANTEKPKYSDYQALVKVESCGICNGTDMKIIHGNFKGFNTYPAILGHEGVGTVIEKGKKVRNFDIGDYVMQPLLFEPIDGYYPGYGGFAEYAIVGDWEALIEDGVSPEDPDYNMAYITNQKIPMDFDPVSSTMIITFKEVLSAMKNFGFTSGKSLVVYGSGPVGLCFIKFAKLMGMGPVIVLDIVDEKVEYAKKMGADYAFNSTKIDVAEEVRRICKDGCDFTVDAVGINALLNQAMELIKPSGTMCVYGISPKLGMEIDWSKAPYNWQVKFIQWPEIEDAAEVHEQIVDWVKEGVLDPKDYISHVIDFDHIIEAYDLVAQRKANKIAIKF